VQFCFDGLVVIICLLIHLKKKKKRTAIGPLRN